MLGTSLVSSLGTEYEVVGVDLRDFDIAQEAAVQKAFWELRPQFVYHLAAYTDVDGCESNPQMAHAVNALGTRNIASSCAEVGAVMLYVSTDYVFDGSSRRAYREDDSPNPLCVYGESKLAGERYVQALVPRHFIVRSSWLYGPYGKNFVATILKLATERSELRVVSDQRGSPTYTLHLARLLAEMPRVEAYGIYHATGLGDCSWFEFAQTIVKSAGLEGVGVVPISTEESGRKARRPANSVLENRRLTECRLGLLPHWEKGLAHYVQEGQRLGEFMLAIPNCHENLLQSEVAGA
jgi:dTDP-4-dehydrorhamnose reductase